MALQADAMDDMIKGTLKELGRGRWTHLVHDAQEYIAVPQLFRKDRVKIQNNGYGVQRNVQVRHLNAARMTGLYAQDQVNVGPLMEQITAPWRYMETHYGFDLHEISMNSGAAAIFDMIKAQRASAFAALVELAEDQLWGKPVDSSDTDDMFGIFYWLVQNATTGFNGGNPSGFSAGAGGLSSTTFPNWKNYTGQYAAVTKADLIKLMRGGFRKTNFKTPSIEGVKQYTGSGKHAIYMPLSVLEQMEEVGEDQNDNLGRDVASMDGRMAFRGVSMKWVPQLDGESNAPVYFIDWSQWEMMFMSGWHLKESPPQMAFGRHNVRTVFVDLQLQLICTNRRANAVFQTA